MLRRVCATIAGVEKQYVILWVCICSLRYPACKAHAPYCHPWPARHFSIFPHYLINGTVFANSWLNINCVVWCSVRRLSETFLILRRAERDTIKKCKLAFVLSTRYYCPNLIKFEFSRQIFEKSSNIKLHENRSSGGRVSRARTDGQIEMTKLFAILRMRLTWIVQIWLLNYH